MATAQELMEQNPELSKAVTELEEQTLEEQVLAKLKEIEAILTKLDSESIDLSVFLNQIQSFSDEKKAELQALVDKLDNPLGEKTITAKTFTDDFQLVNGGLYWQEVYKKDGVITKYGDVYFTGYNYGAGEYGGFGTSSGGKRQPLPSDVEFDYIGGNFDGFFARPKSGQSDKGGVGGSLDNVLFVWGVNSKGELGIGNNSSTMPTPITFPSRVTKIAVGSYNGGASGTTSAYVILENGDLMACGDNTLYQLGLGNNISTTTFQKVASDVKNVWATYGAMMYVTSNTLYAVGYCQNGFLGVGVADQAYQTTPKRVTSVSDPLSVKISMGNMLNSSGYGYTYFAIDGVLYGAGYNAEHQINGSGGNILTITQVQPAVGLNMKIGENDSINCCYYSGFVLKEEGGNFKLYSGGYGYLGDSDKTTGGTRQLTEAKEFLGTGWKMISTSIRQENVYASTFIYNEKTREAWACGNYAQCLGLQKSGDQARLAEVYIPKEVREAKEVEFYLKHYNTEGGIFIIADGEIWATGTLGSNRIKQAVKTLQKIDKEF